MQHLDAVCCHGSPDFVTHFGPTPSLLGRAGSLPPILCPCPKWPPTDEHSAQGCLMLSQALQLRLESPNSSGLSEHSKAQAAQALV